MEKNRAQELLQAALADCKIQLKKSDYKDIAEKVGCSTETIRLYVSQNKVYSLKTAKEILVAATELIKNREAETQEVIESFNLIKE